jgi:hypothetical protein
LEQGERKVCDICRSGEDVSEVSADEMRQVVARGFDPFSTRLVDETTISHWSRGMYDEIYDRPDDRDFTPAFQEALRNWTNDLVATETSAWRFCAACGAKVAAYTSALGMPRYTAQEVAAQRNVQALVFGDSGNEIRSEPGRPISPVVVIGLVVLVAFSLYWFVIA